MNKLAILLTLLALLMSSVVVGAKLKAMLYCYLPKLNEDQDFNKLSQLINAELAKQGINVLVHTCTPQEAALLYSKDINKLFTNQGNDIAEIDVSYIWALKTEDLFQFTKEQVSNFYGNVYNFQWVALTKDDGKLVGSPGLLCSDFIESRPIQGKDHLSSDYSKDSALARLYLGYHLNKYRTAKIDDIEHIITSIDDSCIKSVVGFLQTCQSESSTFDYKKNWCLGSIPRPPFVPSSTEITSTIGYSQNLFSLIHTSNFQAKDLNIKHITGNMERKLFYIDAFVAKKTTNEEDQKTILKFYQFMLSDKVLQIYTSGSYIGEGKSTYLLSPVKKYYEEATDRLVKEIYESTFKIEGFEGLTIYQQIYNEKSKALGTEVRKKLVAYNPNNEL